jgi:IstB-like ATP binding protein
MTTTKPASDVAFLCRALKAPSLAAAVGRLGERARAEGWSHEEFLAACLEREVAARQDHGGENRIRSARFPARKTLEDFDFGFQRSIKRDAIAHLATLDFTAEAANVVFLGPPGTGKTHLAIGLGIRACQATASGSKTATSGGCPATKRHDPRGVKFHLPPGGQLSAAVDTAILTRGVCRSALVAGGIVCKCAGTLAGRRRLCS